MDCSNINGTIIANGSVNIELEIYLKHIATGVANIRVAHIPNCGINKKMLLDP